MEEIKTLFDTLSSTTLTEQGLFTSLEQYASYVRNTLSVNENREDFAQVYILFLKNFTKFYYNVEGKELDDNWVNLLIACFENIKNIVFNDNEQNETSDLKVLYLLKILKEDTTAPQNIERIYSYAETLLEDLSELEFVFEIKGEQGDYYFPLSNIIQQVIYSKFFCNQANKINPGNIHLLQMAVRLFQKNSDINRTLNDLIHNYNLKFINYLSNDCKLLDDKELHNYHNNRVMVFLNENNNMVLIRNDKKEYFSNDKKEYFSNNKSVEEERNSKGDVIGFFVEEKLGKGNAKSFDDLIDIEENRIPLLKLLFDNENMNIFLKESLFQNSKKEIIPVNPYCKNDKFIIYPSNTGYESKSPLPQNDPRYNLYTIKNEDSDNPLDRITFGLCWFLLSQKNTGTKQLLNAGYDCDWYQNKILSNWILDPRVNKKDIKELIKLLVTELRECIDLNELSDRDIRSQSFLPFDGDISNILLQKILGKDAEKDDLNYQVVKTKLIRDDDSENISLSIENTLVPISDIKSEDETFDFENLYQETVYIIKSNKENEYSIIDQNTLKSIHTIQEIQKKCLPYNLFRKNGKVLFNELCKKMELFKDGFSDTRITNNYPCLKKIEEQYYIRILYNLVWLKINTDDKVQTYINIIKSHQTISFNNTIEQIQKVLKEQKNGLFIIPKDQYSSDSVLLSAYNKYYKPTSTRDSFDLYNNNIYIENGKYFYNNKQIDKLAFLTDNSLNGTATKNGLQKRLDKETTDIRDSNGNGLTIQDILTRNEINTLMVYCIFGTEEAKEQIGKFLEVKDIISEVIIENQLNSSHIDVEMGNAANQIFKQNIKDYSGFIPVFREFSMPKKCIFPDQMLDNPQKVVCLFIRKKEL